MLPKGGDQKDPSNWRPIAVLHVWYKIFARIMYNSVVCMPRFAQGKDDVFVGRIRRDESQAKSLNLWIVADNLRKGAATNAVQIAQLVANL